MGPAVDEAELMAEIATTPDATVPRAPSDAATVRDARQALEAHRAEMRTTAERLGASTRRALDVRSRLRERLERDPARTVAFAAGSLAVVAFLVGGGPSKAVQAIRRSTRGARDGDRAYEALPGSLRAMIDASVPGFGAAREDARREMALAIHAWRSDPTNRSRADRLVSELLTPPGPNRVFWVALEASLATAATIVIRSIVRDATRRALAGGPSPRRMPSGPTPPRAADPGTTAAARSASYSGWCGRRPAAPTGPTKPR